MLNSFSKYQKTLAKKEELDLDTRLSVLYAAVDELRERLEACVQREEREGRSEKKKGNERKKKKRKDTKARWEGSSKSAKKTSTLSNRQKLENSRRHG